MVIMVTNNDDDDNDNDGYPILLHYWVLKNEKIFIYVNRGINMWINILFTGLEVRTIKI